MPRYARRPVKSTGLPLLVNSLKIKLKTNIQQQTQTLDCHLQFYKSICFSVDLQPTLASHLGGGISMGFL